MLTIQEVFTKINDIGKKIFDVIFGVIQNLPGIFQGIFTVAILFFLAIGLLSVFKKSIKFFMIIVIAIVALIVVGFMLK